MADPNSVGTTGKPFRMDIERGKIREFARATGSTNPDYFGERPPVPPTFLMTQMFWAEEDNEVWDAVQLDQQRGLHAEQEFIFHGPPPHAGDRLEATSRIDSVFTKTGRRGGEMTFAVMVTEFRDQSGRLVAEAKLTGVETARPPGEDAAGQSSAGRSSAGQSKSEQTQDGRSATHEEGQR